MTTPRDDFESQFRNRLQSFADVGATGLPPSEVDLDRPDGSTRPVRSRFSGAIPVAVTAVFGVAVTILGLALLTPQPEVGATKSSAHSPTAADVSPSALATPAESVAPILGGETPDPKATAPEGAIFIPEMTIEKLSATFGAVGLSCESHASPLEGEAGVFYLYCAGKDEATGYGYTAIVRYWTLERVTSYHLVALPLGDSGDPSLTRSVIDPAVGISFAGETKSESESWVATELDNKACASEPCTKSFGLASIAVQVGELGAWTVTVTGTAVEGA